MKLEPTPLTDEELAEDTKSQKVPVILDFTCYSVVYEGDMGPVLDSKIYTIEQNAKQRSMAFDSDKIIGIVRLTGTLTPGVV